MSKSSYKLFTNKKSEKTQSYWEHWADVQVSANDQDPLAIELVNNLKNFDGAEYDNGQHRYRVTSSPQFGSTIWQNESRKGKGQGQMYDQKYDQKKQYDERNKKIQDMADKRDQKFDELITAIDSLKTALQAMSAALEYHNQQIDKSQDPSTAIGFRDQQQQDR